MFIGIFGMDSTVAKIYELFDKLEDVKKEPIETRTQKEQEIQAELMKKVRKYCSTLYTDFERHFQMFEKYIASNSQIPDEVKDKYTQVIQGLTQDYENSEIEKLIERYRKFDASTEKSFKDKNEANEEIRKYMMSYLSKSFESDDDLKHFMGTYSDFNSRTWISQIPKYVNRIPDFNINNPEHIQSIIDLYHQSYEKFQKFDASTVEWDLSFEQAVRSGNIISLREAKISHDYLASKGKTIRALSAIYPAHSPKFGGNITKEQFLEIFNEYLDSLANNCPYLDYFDFFNELAYDSGMHQMMNNFEAGRLLEPSIYEELLGEDYYIQLIEMARDKFPDTKLMYNDFGHESKEKCEKILKILDKIQEREKIKGKKLLDGVGVQCRLTSENQDLRSVDWFIQQASERGLEVQITEVDVIKVDKEKYMDKTDTRTPEERQKAVYQGVIDIATKHKDSITGFTLGDFNDITSFSAQQQRAKILSNDPSPTCYDKEGQIKPWAREILSTYKNEVVQQASANVSQTNVNQTSSSLQISSD